MLRAAMLTLVGVAIMALAASAHAEVKLTGYFIARDACPALQSIRQPTNLGNIALEPGHSYPLVAKNRPAASHYLVVVDGAAPERRWVEVQCGEHVVPADGSAPPEPGEAALNEPGDEPPFPNDTTAPYVFAISWQAGFCETKKRDKKKECVSQTDTRFDATHFTLHGLWPAGDPFCGFDPATRNRYEQLSKGGKWNQLPPVKINAETKVRLDEVMPGTMSYLERHEWIKHGTCFSPRNEEHYFARSIILLDQINGSPVQTLFASRAGKEITMQEVRDSFDASFGTGAGDRVKMECKPDPDGARMLVTELRISLEGQITVAPVIADLLMASRPAAAGCQKGIVDPIGYQ